jgi:hypothetical protein
MRPDPYPIEVVQASAHQQFARRNACVKCETKKDVDLWKSLTIHPASNRSLGDVSNLRNGQSIALRNANNAHQEILSEPRGRDSAFVGHGGKQVANRGSDIQLIALSVENTLVFHAAKPFAARRTAAWPRENRQSWQHPPAKCATILKGHFVDGADSHAPQRPQQPLVRLAFRPIVFVTMSAPISVSLKQGHFGEDPA